MAALTDHLKTPHVYYLALVLGTVALIAFAWGGCEVIWTDASKTIDCSHDEPKQ
jgi:hypothetical protein